MNSYDQSMQFRTVLLTLIIFCTLGWGVHSTVSSQIFVGLGGQAGFMNLPAANAAVDFFNSQGFLIRRQNKFRWPTGLIYTAGYKDDDLLIELSLNTKRHRTRAEFADGNQIARREHRFVIQSISGTAGGAVVQQETFLLYLCGSLDFGMMRYRTRTGNSETINRANFNTVNQQRFIGTTLSLRMVFRNAEDDFTHWTLAPYVQFPFAQFDFIRFNQTLNPFTWQQVGGESTSRAINYGMSLSFDFDLLELLD